MDSWYQKTSQKTYDDIMNQSFRNDNLVLIIVKLLDELMGMFWKQHAVLDVILNTTHQKPPKLQPWTAGRFSLFSRNKLYIKISKFYSEYMLEEAKKKPHSDAFEFMQGNVEQLPFDDNSFDTVVCFIVILYLYHTKFKHI